MFEYKICHVFLQGTDVCSVPVLQFLFLEVVTPKSLCRAGAVSQNVRSAASTQLRGQPDL